MTLILLTQSKKLKNIIISTHSKLPWCHVHQFLIIQSLLASLFSNTRDLANFCKIDLGQIFSILETKRVLWFKVTTPRAFRHFEASIFIGHTARFPTFCKFVDIWVFKKGQEMKNIKNITDWRDWLRQAERCPGQRWVNFISVQDSAESILSLSRRELFTVYCFTRKIRVMVRVRKISKTDPDLNRFIFKILQNWQKHRDAPRVLKARVSYEACMNTLISCSLVV